MCVHACLLVWLDVKNQLSIWRVCLLLSEEETASLVTDIYDERNVDVKSIVSATTACRDHINKKHSDQKYIYSQMYVMSCT